MQEKLKKIYIKAKRRGIQEMDILLGYVADNFLDKMNEKEIEMFSNLLDQDDAKILKWVLEKEPLPKEFDNKIWQFVKSYKTPYK